MFLDPEYYPECSWIGLRNFTLRDSIVERLLEVLPREVLSEFAASYRTPRIEGWRTVLQATVRTLEQSNDVKLATTFGAALDNIERIFIAENMGEQHALHAALNAPALAQTLRAVDEYVEEQAGTFSVVHDESMQFGTYLEHMSRALAQPNSYDIQLQHGDKFRLFVGSMKEFSFEKSRDSAGLQLADLVASSIGRLVRDISDKEKHWSPGSQLLAARLFPSLLQNNALFVREQLVERIQAMLAT